MRLRCAWAGCRSHCTSFELPPGWIFLATFYKTAHPGHLDFLSDKVERDGALCPEHAQQLERCLQPLPSIPRRDG